MLGFETALLRLASILLSLLQDIDEVSEGWLAPNEIGLILSWKTKLKFQK